MKKKKLTEGKPHAHTKSKTGRKAIDPGERKTQVTLYVEWRKVEMIGGYAALVELLHSTIDGLIKSLTENELTPGTYVVPYTVDIEITGDVVKDPVPVPGIVNPFE